MNKLQHAEIWKRPSIIVCGTVILFFLNLLISSIFIELIPVTSANFQVVLFMGMNLIVLFSLLSIVWAISGYSWRSLAYRWPSWKNLLKIIPAFIGYFIVSSIFAFVVSKVFHNYNANQTQDIGFQKTLHQPLQLAASFIGLVILTPIFEETIFRGLIFRGLRQRLPFWFCAILTSVLFAIAHRQWNIAVDTFALSLALCYLIEDTKSIVPSMLLHGLKNSLAFILLFIIK